MKILVLYSLPYKLERKTVSEHLFSFQKYLDDHEFHYCNVLISLPNYLRLVDYDAIIFHYTFISMRWAPKYVWKNLLKGCRFLKKSKAFKIAIPQDEYAHSDDICELIREFNIEAIFTCAHPEDYFTLYPKEKAPLKHFVTTYPGFVDEDTEEKIHKLAQQQSREIDIGYRARALPYWLGRFGQYKKEIAEVFLKQQEKTSLKFDISTDPDEVFYAEDWLKFLLRCKYTIGCLGGASLHDSDGSIRHKTEEFCQRNPNASFKEAEAACFPGRDNSLSLFTLSPRHFECAMTRTCQILLEGNYHQILIPGKHFIELKKDYSNLNEVIKLIKNDDLRKKITDQAYEDLIASGKYGYKRFAQDVLKLTQNYRTYHTKDHPIYIFLVKRLLKIRNSIIFLHRFNYRFRYFFVKRAQYIFIRIFTQSLKKTFTQVYKKLGISS